MTYARNVDDTRRSLSLRWQKTCRRREREGSNERGKDEGKEGVREGGQVRWREGGREEGERSYREERERWRPGYQEQIFALGFRV
jgi:hypothetical protein